MDNQLAQLLAQALRLEHVDLSLEHGYRFDDGKRGYHTGWCTVCELLKEVELEDDLQDS
mgnify:FL=1